MSLPWEMAIVGYIVFELPRGCLHIFVVQAFKMLAICSALLFEASMESLALSLSQIALPSLFISYS